MKERFKNITESEIIEYAIKGIKEYLYNRLKSLEKLVDQNFCNKEIAKPEQVIIDKLMKNLKELIGYQNNYFRKSGLFAIIKLNRLTIREFNEWRGRVYNKIKGERKKL